MKMLLYLVFLCTSVVFCQEKATLTIDFTNLNAEAGKLYVALYTNENDFLKKEYTGKVINILQGKATICFAELEMGEYAVSSFYDKNENGILDTNVLGIPNEPYQFSNKAKRLFGPPTFKHAKIEVKRDTLIQIDY